MRFLCGGLAEKGAGQFGGPEPGLDRSLEQPGQERVIGGFVRLFAVAGAGK